VLAVARGADHRAQPSRAGFGVVGEIATGFPGYDSMIRKENGTVGAILKNNGYATSWFGKNHNTPFFQATPGRTLRPVAERHGLRVLLRLRRRRRQPVAAEPVPQHDAIYPFEGNAGWNLTTAMADEAIQYMKELKEIAPDKPSRLLRAGRHPCAAPPDAGVDQEDQ
jgi:arylsulfatase A-like enzyme